MASTLTKILLHVAFSTHHLAALIDPAWEQEMFAYIGGICRRMNSPLLAINGVADHVHMSISLSKTVALANLMLEVKRDSSHWAKQRLSGFAWQEGYFAFSIGESGLDDLNAYIANQKTHYAQHSFQDEVRAFLRKYNIAWDEDHVWS